MIYGHWQLQLKNISHNLLMQVKKLLSLETCQECICLRETMNFNFIRTEMDICFDYDCYKLVWFQVKLVTLTKHINVMLDKI